MNAPGPNRPPKRVAAKLALLAGALLLALLLCEGAVRLLGFAPEISRINPMMKKTVFKVSENPLLGYTYKENYRDPDADLVTSYPYINAHGFRDIEREFEKPPGVKRVILLGDSVVTGHMNIASHDETLSREFEKLLEGRNIEVLNMGITGYCTRGEVELLKEVGLKYSPDLVVVVFVTNDFIDMNMELGYVTPSEPIQFLVLHSHLFRYLGIQFNLFDLRTHFGVQEIAGEWAGWLHVKRDGRRDRILNSEEERSVTVRDHLSAIGGGHARGLKSNVHQALPELRRLADDHGFQVVVGIWPFFLPEGIVTHESYGTDLVEPRTDDERLVVEEIALADGIPIFRFDAVFREDYEARRRAAKEAPIPLPPALYAPDSMHPNPQGARVGARALLRMIERYPDLIGGNAHAIESDG